MKATLEFNLPEDQPEFNTAIKGSDWRQVCWEMDQWLRAQYKHMPDEEYSQDSYEAYYQARQKLNELVNENGVSEWF